MDTMQATNTRDNDNLPGEPKPLENLSYNLVLLGRMSNGLVKAQQRLHPKFVKGFNVGQLFDSSRQIKLCVIKRNVLLNFSNPTTPHSARN